MGTTCMHREKGISSRDFFAREFGRDTIVDCAMIGRTFYAAVRLQSGQVVGAVVTTSRHSKDYYNFCFKVMDENMHPFYYECPKRVLDVLTPTDNTSANEWRAKCYENCNRRKPSCGDLVKFTTPIRFSNGKYLHTFWYQNGSRFRDYTTGVFYKISKWKFRDYTIGTL